MYRSLADLIRCIVAGQLPISNTLGNMIGSFEACKKNLQWIKNQLRDKMKERMRDQRDPGDAAIDAQMGSWQEYRNLTKKALLLGKRLEIFGKALKLFLGKEPAPMVVPEKLSLENQISTYMEYIQNIFNIISKQAKNPQGDKYTLAEVKRLEEQGLELLKEVRSLSTQILPLKEKIQ